MSRNHDAETGTIAGLRYCHQVKRIVETSEPHAGVFSSSRCRGCAPIEQRLRGMVISDLEAQRERATRLLLRLGDSS